MKLMLMGDYYVWYCEWCDSRNLTLWTRIDAEKVSCGCCHREFVVSVQPVVERKAGLSSMFQENFHQVNQDLNHNQDNDDPFQAGRPLVMA